VISRLPSFAQTNKEGGSGRKKKRGSEDLWHFGSEMVWDVQDTAPRSM
jgi:hypothetical protein